MGLDENKNVVDVHPVAAKDDRKAAPQELIDRALRGGGPELLATLRAHIGKLSFKKPKVQPTTVDTPKIQKKKKDVEKDPSVEILAEIPVQQTLKRKKPTTEAPPAVEEEAEESAEAPLKRAKTGIDNYLSDIFLLIL
jgi:hypothetical protein